MITLLRERILVLASKESASTRRTLSRKIASSVTIGNIMELQFKGTSVYYGDNLLLYRNEKNQFCVNIVDKDVVDKWDSVGKFLEDVFAWMKKSHDAILSKFNWDPYNEGEYLVVGYSEIFGGGIITSCDEFTAHRVKKALVPYYGEMKLVKNSNENVKKIHDELLEFESRKYGI